MCIGKWHLGDRPEVLPTAQGFDHYFGLPYSNDMARKKGWGNGPDDLDKIWRLKKWDIYNNHLYRDTERIEGPVKQVTLTVYKNNHVEAVRAGKWKLRVGYKKAPDNGRSVIGNVELYDLDAEIGETTNVADQHPEVVARLKKLV